MSFKFVQQDRWDKNHNVRKVLRKQNIDYIPTTETSEVTDLSEVEPQEKQVKIARRRPVVTVRRPQATQ